MSDDNSYAAVLARLTELERRQEELRLAHESTAALVENLSRELDDLRDEVRGYDGDEF